MLRGTYPRVPVDCHCVCDTGEWVNFLIAGRIKDYLVLMCKGRNITTLGCYKHLITHLIKNNESITKTFQLFKPRCLTC